MSNLKRKSTLTNKPNCQETSLSKKEKSENSFDNSSENNKNKLCDVNMENLEVGNIAENVSVNDDCSGNTDFCERCQMSPNINNKIDESQLLTMLKNCSEEKFRCFWEKKMEGYMLDIKRSLINPPKSLVITRRQELIPLDGEKRLYIEKEESEYEL